MSTLKIKSFNGKKYGENDFFILNRGNNSGKPLIEPCANCFICECSSIEEKEKAYWLFFALWQGKLFSPLLVGSVIPFIRKNDLINLVDGYWNSIGSHDEVKNKVHQLNTVLDQEQNFKKMLSLASQLKMVLSLKLLNIN